ncbi:MAG: cupin domain-containing protein [Bryobacteraceae bacterium]|nr:cupin domain-containing protein [Bryobacteraceae bacterium]
MRRNWVIALLLGSGLAAGQTLWAPKEKTGYTPPHKPHTKLSDLKQKHQGEKSWREVVVDDEHLRSEYLFVPPGTKQPRGLHPDTRAWWVVMDGEVRFDIETKDSFVARKGSMVQVPMQTLFSWEVTGDRPALIFETNVAGARTLYVNQGDAPKSPGVEWVPVKMTRRIGDWEYDNKPHVTFDEIAKKLESGEVKGTQRIVQDDRGTANFIYGYEKQLPPIDPKARGHYHPEGAEYWLIMAGQIRYPIEGVGLVIASEGDVVYVPKHTFHAPRWHGEGPSCRLAMNGFPFISHLFDPD